MIQARFAGRSVHRMFAVARAGVVGAVILACGHALVPLLPAAAQAPSPNPSPKYVPPKVCPPPEGFRAILHLLDNKAPSLQMYPLPGLKMPVNMFKVFGQDMIPKCALERTYDDLARFRTEASRFAEVTPDRVLTPRQLLDLCALSYRGFKRWQWCLLLATSKAPEFEYDGSKIPELTEALTAYYTIAMDAGKKFIPAVTGYFARFKGVENDAVDAKKRLDEDEKRPRPRPAKEIAKDQAKVEDYERRFKENGELIQIVRSLRDGYKVLAATHTLQKFSWTGGTDPALTLRPMARQLDAIHKQIGGR